MVAPLLMDMPYWLSYEFCSIFRFGVASVVPAAESKALALIAD